MSTKLQIRMANNKKKLQGRRSKPHGAMNAKARSRWNPAPPMLISGPQVRNFTMRFKALPLVTSGNENRRLAMDLSHFFCMYSIVLNATTNVANNVRSLFNSMLIRRVQLWNTPSSQLLGTTGTSVQGFAGPGAWVRLGAPNIADVTASGQAERVFQIENVGSSEPGYIDVRPRVNDAIGRWFNPGNSIDLGTAVSVSSTNVGALTVSCQAGSIIDITFDATFQTDPSSDTDNDGYFTVVYTTSQVTGTIISFVGPYGSGTNQGWTCVTPYKQA